MALFKPNVEKLLKKQDVRGLGKALDFQNESIQREAIDAIAKLHDSDEKIESLIAALQHDLLYVRNTAATTLGSYKDKAVVEALLAAMKNTENAISSLTKIGDPTTIAPIVGVLTGWSYVPKRNVFLSLLRKYGIENQVVRGIAQGLGFPDIYPEDETIYNGKSPVGLLKHLSAAMERIPFLTSEQITIEYEYLKKSRGWEVNPLLGETPRGLLSGVVSDVKKAIQKQLLADKAWLSAPKTSYELRSGGWDARILTKYTRGYVVLAYPTKLWRSSQEDGKEFYYYSFSPERNW